MNLILKKDTVYLLSFLSILTIVSIVSYLNVTKLISISTKELLKNQIEFSKREAEEIANLIASQINSGIPKDKVIQNVQNSIEDVNVELGFICMFDWSGKEICHPNPNMIGKTLQREQSFVSGVGDDEKKPQDLYDYLIGKQKIGGIVTFSDKKRPSEVIYLYPVKNTDWIVAAHADLKSLKNNLKDLKINFILIQSLAGIAIIFLCFFITRLIGGKYERQLENKNEDLKNRVLNIDKLTESVNLYKQKIEKKPEKNRILTYIKNELKPINTNDIAYVFSAFKVTYVVCFNEKKSIFNNSLEELNKQLDKKVFFRVNRQYLISIKAIDKIVKYGNSQLKIEVVPKSEEDIIISKNKVSEFKEWLNN